MTTPSDRLDAIEARLVVAAPGAITITPSDVSYLLDLARKQQAVIAELSRWAGAAKTGYYDEAQDDVVQIIRPALERTTHP